MQTNDLRALLTPAAREMMGELVRDFGERLLLSAADAATRAGTDLREISVSDLAQAFSRLQPESVRSRRTLVERVLEMYMALGVVTGFVGIAGLVAAHYFGRAFLGSDSVAVAVSAGGYFLVFFSFLMQRTRVYNRVMSTRGSIGLDVALHDTAVFIRNWSELELALRERASMLVGETAAHKPISEIAELLRNAGALNAGDLETVQRLLRVRNNVVHGPGPGDPRLLREAIADSRLIMQRLMAAGVS